MRINRNLLLLLVLTIGMASCKKEYENIYVVNKVKAGNATVTKPNRKSTLEFVSILYSDLLGSSVPQQELIKMISAYDAFGDGAVVEDLIVRNLMNRTGVSIPSNTEMRANPDVFIQAAYKRFLAREASDYEVWYFRNQIEKNTDITPDLIYYVLLTSDEYRYY
jgi:hypothetical protein